MSVVCAQHGRWWLCGENASINERIKLFPLCISSLFRVTIYQQNKAVLSSFIWLKKQKTLVWLLHIFNPFWKLLVRAKLWGKADDFSYCFINTFCKSIRKTILHSFGTNGVTNFHSFRKFSKWTYLQLFNTNNVWPLTV